MDCCVIHKSVEQLLIEIHRQLPHFLKPRNESAENVILDFLPLPFFLQAVLPALQGGIPACISVILFAVIVLVKFPCGIPSTSLWISPAVTSFSLLTASSSASMVLLSARASMTALQSPMTFSRFSIRMPSASRNSTLIRCSYRCGVAHLLSPLNLALHCHIVRLYLLLECQTLEPKYSPQSPHFSFAENGLQQLWLRPRFFLRCISICTSCHSAGSMMASWLPST